MMEAICSSETLVGTRDIPDYTYIVLTLWILAGNYVHCWSEGIQLLLYLLILILFTLIMSWNYCLCHFRNH